MSHPTGWGPTRISGIARIPRGMRNAAKRNLCSLTASRRLVLRTVEGGSGSLSKTIPFFTSQNLSLREMLPDRWHVATVSDLSILCDEFEAKMSCCRYNRLVVNLRQFLQFQGFLDDCNVQRVDSVVQSVFNYSKD